MPDHPVKIEEATIRAFVQKNRQERCINLLANPKRRRKFTAELAHFKWLDERFALTIPASVARGASEIASVLRSKGARENVWIISEDSAIDGKELELKEALDHICGRGIGSFLSCIAGKLGYFEDEDGRFLLER